MKTYWPTRPPNVSTSDSTCSGVYATKLTTTSNSRSPTASRTEARSRMSARSSSVSAAAGRMLDWPRLSSARSWPAASTRGAQAELRMPVPPMNRIRMPPAYDARDVAEPDLTGHPAGLDLRLVGSAERERDDEAEHEPEHVREVGDRSAVGDPDPGRVHPLEYEPQSEDEPDR